MAKSVTLRQGTAAEHAGFTGQMAEVTFDTTNNTVILHDGSTPGGIPMAKLSDVPVDLTDLTDVDGNINTATNIGAFSGTTYTVTVASGTNGYGTGNKYYITDLTDASPTVTLTEGVTYRFDQSDSTNTGHPLKFSTTADGTHDSGIEYTTGVTYNGVPGQADAYTEITVEVGAPTLYYYCQNHSGMGDAPAPPPTPMWSLSGDSNSFVAVSDSKLDTSAASYVALNQPSGRGNAWALEDGSYALRNNPNLVNDPTTRPLHIWSTDDLSDGMTTQYWIKFDANQPAMWEALHGVEAGSSQAYSYSISLAYAVHTLAWAGNGAYGYFGHTSNGSSSFPDQGWLHIAEEIQSNGRQVIYINGVVVVNESASDLSGLTNKANLYIGSVSSWITDIEVYTGGGIHNPDLLATPPGFTPPARKVAASTGWTNTWTMTSNFDTYVGEDVSERQSLAITGIASQGGIDPWILAYPLQWSDDGYMLYIQGNGQQWIQHGVSTPWDPTSIIDRNATTTSTSTATVPQGSNRLLFRVVDGGDKVLSWRGSGTTQNVYMDTLSTSGDLTSKVNTTTNIWSAQSMIDLDGSYWKIDHMSPDGTKLYVVTDGTSASINATTQKWEVSRGAGTTIIEFTLSTAWDLTTISVTNSQSYSWYTPNRNNWRSVNFTPDGLTVYTMAKESSYSVELKEHNLTTAWDISTASMNSNTLKLFGTNIDPVAATFTGDGTKIHFFDANLVKTIDLEVY